MHKCKCKICILCISLTNWTYDQNFTLYFKTNCYMLNCALIIKTFKQLVCINIFYLEEKNPASFSSCEQKKQTEETAELSEVAAQVSRGAFNAETPPFSPPFVDVTFSILKCSAIIFWHLWIYLLRNRFQCCDFVIMALNAVGQPCRSMFR